MKAYLYIEKDLFCQDQMISCVTDNDYDEVDLLPDDFPQDYLDKFCGRVVFHAHPFAELLHIIEGRVLYIVDKKLCFLERGDIIFFNSFIPHAQLLLEEDTLINDYAFSGMLQSDAQINQHPPLDNTIQNLRLRIKCNRSDRATNPCQTHQIISLNELSMQGRGVMDLINADLRYMQIKHNAPEYDIFIKILNSIEGEVRNKNVDYEYILHAKLMELVVNLFRLHLDRWMKPEPKSRALLTSALNYISENIHQNLCLESVAKHCYLTPQYFSVYFKKHVGMNFSKYLIEVRVERAKKELIETDDSVLEIVYRCGFNSKSSFYRAWYSKYEISPTKFRNLYKKRP